MTIYRGISGVNRQITRQFRGIGGVNREITAQYRGIAGVNKLVFIPNSHFYPLKNFMSADGYIQITADSLGVKRYAGSTQVSSSPDPNYNLLDLKCNLPASLTTDGTLQITTGSTHNCQIWVYANGSSIFSGLGSPNQSTNITVPSGTTVIEITTDNAGHYCDLAHVTLDGNYLLFSLTN